MADLLEDGQSTWDITGTPDTATLQSNGPNGSDIVAENVNGPALGVRKLQTVLGNALTLKGTAASLAARLAVGLAADGALPKGISFPESPIDGQPFYRVDTNQLYIYDAGEPAWKTVFQGQDISTLDHGALGGLADDDHPQYATLVGTRDFTADLKVRKTNPGLRLTGTEGSGKDIRIIEDATNYFKVQRNDASEGAPSWTDVVTMPMFLMNLPKTTGGGSTNTHHGPVVVTTNTSLAGINFYSNFTLNVGVQITVPDGAKRLVIIATDTITINGVIDAAGAGPAGGAGAANETEPGRLGAFGTDQAGGQGGGGSVTIQGGKVAAVLNGCAVTEAQLTDVDISLCMSPWLAMGGSGGSGGGGGVGPNPGGAGGNGGGSIVLVAPTIILGSSSQLITSGNGGANGSDGGGNFGGPGGGGGAGNVYIMCRTYSDLGCTFTQNGGSPGGITSGASSGMNGVRQIMVLN